jgi:hypothetical protein
MESDPSRRLVSRRHVLEGGALLGAGGVLSRLDAVRDRLRDTMEQARQIVIPLPLDQPNLVVDLRRREDLFGLRIEGWNLRIATGGGRNRQLRRLNRNRPAFLVVVFPSQALGEAPWPMNQTPAPPPLTGFPAHESRLAFRFPSGLDAIDFTLKSLLSWSDLEPAVVPVVSGVAEPPTGGDGGIVAPGLPQIRRPTKRETAIEIPWGLMLSPNEEGGWAHAVNPVTHNGRTELWHTRLGVIRDGQVDEWNPVGRSIQAIFAPPFHADPPLPLDHSDRNDIVRATSDYTLEGRAPAVVNRMMLTSLGGWLDAHGDWDFDPDQHDVSEWRHQATLGRDHYVRVVREGYLFPFGHRAVQVTINERKFEEGPAGGTGAFLRQREFLIIQQPLKRYQASGHADAAPGQPHGGRGWPFRSLRFTTLITPDFITMDGTYPAGAEVPHLGGEPFQFTVTAEDLEGRAVDFDTPALFVRSIHAHNAAAMQDLADAYNAASELPLREHDLSGQKVALAQPSEPGDTALDLGRIVLRAVGPGDDSPPEQDLIEADQPPFYPEIAEFGARLSAADQVSGTGTGNPEAFTFYDRYLDVGFNDNDAQNNNGSQINKGGVFAELVRTEDSPGAPMQIPADRAGGLVTPSFAITALSRELGPTGGDDLADIAEGKFDPAKFFTGVDVPIKLLGGIDLWEIVATVGDFTSQSGAMEIKTHPVVDQDGLPVAVRTELTWEPTLTANPLFEPIASTMRIDATFVQNLEGGEPTYAIEGQLDEFNLHLIGPSPARFMTIVFDRLRFTSGSGEKTEISPRIRDVKFADDGPLAFVNRIEEYLSFGGVGPKIGVDADGITAGVSVAIPTIPIGQVIISDISMSGTLMIPWDGSPARIRFCLGEPENKFSVTYTGIGGGGYFCIAFGLDGLESFGCAVELGAYLSVDFKVVSAAVSIAAGIEFEIDIPGNTVMLTAYIEFSGEVKVLGIGLSLTLYLGLSFVRAADSSASKPQLHGVAKAQITIKLLVWEPTLEFKVKRTLGSPHYTFGDLFTQDHWNEYAAAFAAPLGSA